MTVSNTCAHDLCVQAITPPTRCQRTGVQTPPVYVVALTECRTRDSHNCWSNGNGFRVKCAFTLPASLSGTFLQTLPELGAPLKGHCLPPRSCPPTRSAPLPWVWGSLVRLAATRHPSTHVNTRRVRPGLRRKRVPSRFKRFGFLFVLTPATWAVMKETPDIIGVVCYTHAAI